MRLILPNRGELGLFIRPVKLVYKPFSKVKHFFSVLIYLFFLTSVYTQFSDEIDAM